MDEFDKLSALWYSETPKEMIKLHSNRQEEQYEKTFQL